MNSLNEYDLFRFEDKITKTPTCHVWNGSLDKDKYGIFYAHGISYKAHRMAYFLNKGYLDTTLCVCHTCDNPSCVNPSHLFLGTIHDNNQDRHLKGRSKNKPTKGQDHNMAKLSEEDIRCIRTSSEKVQKELAEQFNVSIPTISRILSNRTWSHI